MSTTVSSIKFPRSNPKKIIEMNEMCLKKHDENPTAVAMPAEPLALWRTQTKEARQLQDELTSIENRKKEIMLALNKTLGVRVGEGLANKTTMIGLTALFRDHAELSFANDIEQLSFYGYEVKVTQKAAPVSKKRLEKLMSEKA